MFRYIEVLVALFLVVSAGLLIPHNHVDAQINQTGGNTSLALINNMTVEASNTTGIMKNTTGMIDDAFDALKDAFGSLFAK